MTQYPQPPYQPPQPGYATPPGYPYAAGSDARGPASRAGILMFVLGGLAVLGGLCCGISGSMIEQILAQQPAMAQELPPDATPEMLRIGLLVVAAVGVVYGIVLIVLGLFVRKSSKAAIIISMILTILTLLYLTLTLIRAAVIGMQQGPAAGSSGVCVSFIPFALYALLLVWLIQAVRNVSAARAAGQYPPEYLAYLQQQYAQQQQAYQQQLWQQQQQQGGQTPPPAQPPQSPPPPPPPTFGSGTDNPK